MAENTEEEIHNQIDQQFGVNTSSLEFNTTTDQLGALAKDVNRVRAYPLLNTGVEVGGAIYDVKTGAITPIDC